MDRHHLEDRPAQTPSRADGTLPPELGGPKAPNLKEKASQASEREEERGDVMRSLGTGTRALARTTVGVGASLSPAPVPRALLILVLWLVAVRRLPALRRCLTEVVSDAPAKERAPAQVTPASPPAVTASPAQRILQSSHGAHAPGAQPALPERPGRLSVGWQGGGGDVAS